MSEREFHYTLEDLQRVLGPTANFPPILSPGTPQNVVDYMRAIDYMNLELITDEQTGDIRAGGRRVNDQMSKAILTSMHAMGYPQDKLVSLAMTAIASRQIQYNGGQNGPYAATLKTLGDIKQEAPTMVIDGLVPETGIVGIGGHPGTGKTWAVLDTAVAVASGQNGLWGKPTRRRPVLVCANGMYKQGVISRLVSLQKGRKITDDVPLWLDWRTFYIDTDAGLGVLEKYMRDDGVRFIVLDMLLDYITNTDIYKGTDTGRLMGRLRTTLERFGAVLLITHHGVKKMEGDKVSRAFGGAIQIGGSMDSAFEAQTHLDVYKFEHIKSRMALPSGETFMAVHTIDGGTTLEWNDVATSDDALVLIERLVEEQGEISKADAVAAMEKAGLPAHNRAWTDLKDEIKSHPALDTERRGKEVYIVHSSS